MSEAAVTTSGRERPLLILQLQSLLSFDLAPSLGHVVHGRWCDVACCWTPFRFVVDGLTHDSDDTKGYVCLPLSSMSLSCSQHCAAISEMKCRAVVAAAATCHCDSQTVSVGRDSAGGALGDSNLLLTAGQLATGSWQVAAHNPSRYAAVLCCAALSTASADDFHRLVDVWRCCWRERCRRPLNSLSSSAWDATAGPPSSPLPSQRPTWSSA